MSSTPNSGVIFDAVLQDQPGQLVPADLDLSDDPREVEEGRLLAQFEFAVRGPDDLDQIVVGDDVPGLAVDDVVQPRLAAPFIPDPLEKDQRIADPPPAIGVHPDVFLVLRRDLVRVAVPFEPALLEIIGFLDEGGLHVQTGLGHGPADRLAELGDDDLVHLGDDVDGVDKDEEHDEPEPDKDGVPGRCLHFFTSSPRLSKGRTPFWLWSMMIFLVSLGRTSLRVSR